MPRVEDRARFGASALVAACIAGVASLVAVPIASAQPSLSVEIKAASVDGDAAYTHAGFANSGLMVIKVWIDGLNDGDSVSALFGMNGSPLTISASSGDFFNAEDFGQASAGHGRPLPGQFADHPELQWDTYLALGTVAFSVSPGFPNIALFEGGDPIVNHTDAAWFAIGGATAVSGKVLIGQFAFPEGGDFEINVGATINFLNVLNLNYSYSAPDPTGACCVDGRCMEMTQAACEALAKVINAVYQGNGTSCDTTNCDPRPVTGACCIGELCQVLTADACTLAGGTFNANQACDQVNCSPPPPQEGACCVMGECVQLTEFFCAATGVGVFHGVGTPCDQVNCSPVSETGACCIFGECQQLTAEICATAMGTFSGVGSRCSQVDCDTSIAGACCIFGSCSQLKQTVCEAAGGTFYGEAMPCQFVTCPVVVPTGACCTAGVCEIKTRVQCNAAGGVYSGDNSECENIVCLPTGACAVNQTCVTLTEEMCDAVGGAFQGVGTACNVQYQSGRAQGSANRTLFWQRQLPRFRDYSHWPEQISPQDSLAEMFTIPSCVTDQSLHNSTMVAALEFRNPLRLNGAARLLLREAVAAVLNAQATQNETCTLDYPIASPEDVVAIVNETLSRCNAAAMYELALVLAKYNNLGSQCQESWYLRNR